MTPSEPAARTDEVRWLDDDEQRTWRAFLDMQTQLAARLNREMLETSGLSSADFAVLVHLSEHPQERMRVLELARGLQWEKSRLSHQLTRMQQRGLVTRSNCDEDRRGAFVMLSRDGREAVESAAPAHVDAVRRYLFDALTADEVAVLHGIAAGTIERLRATCTDAGELCESAANACADGDPAAAAQD